jgi:hypothetical protein
MLIGQHTRPAGINCGTQGTCDVLSRKLLNSTLTFKLQLFYPIHNPSRTNLFFSPAGCEALFIPSFGGTCSATCGCRRVTDPPCSIGRGHLLELSDAYIVPCKFYNVTVFQRTLLLVQRLVFILAMFLCPEFKYACGLELVLYPMIRPVYISLSRVRRSLADVHDSYLSPLISVTSEGPNRGAGSKAQASKSSVAQGCELSSLRPRIKEQPCRRPLRRSPPPRLNPGPVHMS